MFIFIFVWYLIEKVKFRISNKGIEFEIWNRFSCKCKKVQFRFFFHKLKKYSPESFCANVMGIGWFRFSSSSSSSSGFLGKALFLVFCISVHNVQSIKFKDTCLKKYNSDDTLPFQCGSSLEFKHYGEWYIFASFEQSECHDPFYRL